MELIDILSSLIILTLMEVALGIDNLVFLSILSDKLPSTQQKRARQLGLTLAWVMRLILLASAVWLTRLEHPLFYLWGIGLSTKDIFLFFGGLFLIGKATQEIYIDVESVTASKKVVKKSAAFLPVIIQIGLMDILFSLDSVLAAVGLTQRFWLMATAITIAILVMVLMSETLSRWIHKHPSVKILALSFLVLIGAMLIAEACHNPIPRGYIYFSMAFALLVECLNLLRRSKSHD